MPLQIWDICNRTDISNEVRKGNFYKEMYFVANFKLANG